VYVRLGFAINLLKKSSEIAPNGPFNRSKIANIMCSHPQEANIRLPKSLFGQAPASHGRPDFPGLPGGPGIGYSGGLRSAGGG
jgi:hypothetical protein